MTNSALRMTSFPHGGPCSLNLPARARCPCSNGFGRQRVPATFCSTMRGSKPAGDVLNSETPSPDTEVIMTMVSGEPDGVVAPAVPPTMPVTAAGVEYERSGSQFAQMLAQRVKHGPSFHPPSRLNNSRGSVTYMLKVIAYTLEGCHVQSHRAPALRRSLHVRGAPQSELGLSSRAARI